MKADKMDKKMAAGKKTKKLDPVKKYVERV